MAAKIIQVSDDAGVTFEELPGNTGTLTLDGDQLDDTILGQTFRSAEAGLINWGVTSNSIYKGFAGYQAKILKGGTPVTVTAEAMTVESGQIFRIDDAAKEVWDRSATIVVTDGVTPVTDEVEWFDFLFGRIKFVDSYTVVGDITIDVDYIPLAVFGTNNAFTLTMTAHAIDTSDFPDVQANNGHRNFIAGLRTVTLELTGVFNASNTYKADLAAGTEYIIELQPVGQTPADAFCRGFFKIVDTDQGGDVGALEEENVTFNLSVPTGDDPPQVVFNWDYAVSQVLSQSIRILLESFIAQTVIEVQYLTDGAAGYEGECIVTDVTLTGGLDAMNEFEATLQGSDELTAV